LPSGEKATPKRFWKRSPHCHRFLPLLTSQTQRRRPADARALPLGEKASDRMSPSEVVIRRTGLPERDHN
jgi:hypothetical protein